PEFLRDHPLQPQPVVRDGRRTAGAGDRRRRGAGGRGAVRFVAVAAVLAASALLAACSGPRSRPSSSSGAGHRGVSGTASPAGEGGIHDDLSRPQSSRYRDGPYSVRGKTYRVLSTARGYDERGIASFYGNKFHGYKTSNLETYDMYAFSAA